MLQAEFVTVMSASDEVTLPVDALQGDWVGMRGEVIRVNGTELVINGKPMGGGLKLASDGRVFGFAIYRLKAAEAADRVLWNAGPQEIVWRRPAEGEMSSRLEAYRERTAQQNNGLARAADGSDFANEAEAVVRLNRLIEEWREGPLTMVKSSDICPDWTNRAQTGLSVDHVHYIAAMIQMKGFKSRQRGLSSEQGAHDVPVLVKESKRNELGAGALMKWEASISETTGFPPYMLDGKRHFYCSLGNGHFSQALNLFRSNTKSIWTDKPYDVGDDDALREAIDDGVEAVLLSADMPVRDRRFVSEMLNRSHGRPWRVDDDGQVSVDAEHPGALAASQFIALSKVLDAEELSCLVRTKLGVGVDGKMLDPNGLKVPHEDLALGVLEETKAARPEMQARIRHADLGGNDADEDHMLRNIFGIGGTRSNL